MFFISISTSPKAYELIISGDHKNGTKIYGPIKDDLEKFSRQTFRTYFCKAAKQYIAVDTNGKLYPCHRYIGNEEYSIGDISSGFNKNRSRYINASIFEKTKCNSCWARYLCGGGCDNEAETISGDILHPVTSKCEIRRRMLEEGMVLYLRLREQGVDNFDKLFANQ